MAHEEDPGHDPLQPLDFTEFDRAIAEDGGPENLASWTPAGGRAFVPVKMGMSSLAEPDDDDDPDFEEDEPWDPFVSNEAQARLRQAVRTWEFDTIFAAGTISSSKTYGILALIVELCLEYDETHALIVRVKYDSLKDTTKPDLEMLIPPEFIRKWVDLDCHLVNGSIIRLRSANEQSDPQHIWLRGNKPDIGFVDECDGVTEHFMSAFYARIGVQRKRRRRSARERVCPALTFLACNPNIAWPKKHYTDHRDRPDRQRAERFYYQKFTIQDNIAFISEAKQAQWKRVMTPPMYKRFVLGNWDAMSDREQLFLFEDMDRCRAYIPETVVPAEQDPRTGRTTPARTVQYDHYLGVDPAGFGPDKCAFLVMRGPNLLRLDYHQKTSQVDVAAHTKRLMAEYGITPDHVVMDTDGLGAGAADILAAEQIFIVQLKGGAAADPAAFYMENPSDPNSRIHMDNAAFSFHNKRAQVHWEAMQMLRAGAIGNFDTLGYKGPSDPEPGQDVEEINLDETLRADMASIHYGFHKGTKAIQMESKDDIKKRLHRSPDFSDVLVNAIQAYLQDTKKPSMEVFSIG